MPTAVTMKQLLETGVHFGHKARRWNPKMKPYIFTSKNGVHIIDLQQTLTFMNEIHETVSNEVARGGTVLFVGTKRQAQETIAQEAMRCHSPYVIQRWLGGTLTNWKTIKQRIDALKRLERERDEGIFEKLTKKERLMKQRIIERLQYRLGGIRDMVKLPVLMYVVDTTREYTAVREANTLGIPVIALADTNTNPDPIDYLIPANDDAIRSIRLLTAAVADAVIEGQNMRKSYQDDAEELEFTSSVSSTYETYVDDEDEAYLGESTLAKLRDGDLSFDEEEDDEY